jgi:hypothetical protein
MHSPGFFPLLLVLLSAAAFSSCSANPSQAASDGRVTNFTNCMLPADQGTGSLHGSWANLPVPLVFDRDFYVADYGQVLPSMRASLQTWNLWSTLKGKEAYTLTNDGSGITAGRQIPDLTSSCAQATYSASVTDVVAIWKITGEGPHRNQRASCGVDATGAQGKILPTGVQGQTDWVIQNGQITGASILLNFQDYNSPGKQHLDVESLLLHELGHVLGLLHSCNGSSTDATTSPACFTNSGGTNILTVATQYAEAVMFPFLQADQIRRDLMQNDYDRINCLY